MTARHRATRVRPAFTIIVLAGLLTPPATQADADGPDRPASCGTEIACRIAEGEYRIRFPEGWDGRTRLGAIVFLHGWQGTAAGEMRNPAWARLSDTLGVAFVVPQGAGKTWSYPGSPRSLRDEFAFFDNLVSDLSQSFPIDTDRLMVAGFSMGGSMAWNLACHRGSLFAGYAPIAGAFWDPIPESCPSPVPVLYHVHGTNDRTVPLQGRAIGDRWRQSDVAQSLAVWQRQADLPTVFPADAPEDGLACQRQATPSSHGHKGAVLEVCLHSGGHSVKARWIARAWRALAAHLGWDTATK